VDVDGKEFGPISLRTALACSRNIPAVSTLFQIGLPALLEMAQRLGITTLTRDDYGLSLTLGGGEVTLMQMTGAYATLATNGRKVTPRLILRIEDQDGKVIVPEAPEEQPQVVDARQAYIITNILADNNARSPVFGPDSVLKLSFPAAVKTGTTNDYRDAWTIGYSPDLVTGVWVGNSDDSPMDSVGGSGGAGPIWHDFMEAALAGKEHPDFTRPEGIVEVEVCPVSGLIRGDDCPPGRTELFLAEYVPTEKCTVHIRQKICKVSGKLANSYCPLDTVEERKVEDYGPQWDQWLADNGKPVPIRAICDVHGAPSNVTIDALPGPLSGDVEIRGSTLVNKFKYYVVEYGIGVNPIGWGELTKQIPNTVAEGVLCRWNTRTVKDGQYSLRVVVYDDQGHSQEARIVVEVRNASPTATKMVDKQTKKPTKPKKTSATLEPSVTPSPTLEPATPTEIYTPTVLPSLTPTMLPTKTPTPTATPNANPTPPAARNPSPTATVTPVDTPTSTG
jgi:membrane carboxypeptidase/penicillin-binding protein PbpC